MDQGRTFRLRVTYAKSGRLALLSHLEVTHALERMIRRASLPFALSQGFSPHMKISFGSALPVGIGGDAEIFDLTLRDYIAPAKVLAALQEAAPPDLMPSACAYIEPSAKAASVAFPVGTYEAILSRPIDGLLYPEEITVVRKKKEKRIRVDEYLLEEPSIRDERVIFKLASKETGTLRADVFLRAALEETSRAHPDDAPLEVVRITRTSQA